MGRGLSMRSLPATALLLGLSVVGCGSNQAIGSPSHAVRHAFERLAAHDLAGASMVVCPDQRHPDALPFMVGGIFEPIGYISGGDNVAESLALIDLDITGVDIGDVYAGGGTVLVPVGGVLREQFDAVEVEAAYRAAAADRGEPVDEADLGAVLARIKQGPVVLDLDQNMGAVQVTSMGSAWLICEPLASPGPEAPATSES